MHQDPDRHTLLAYFPSRAQAQKARDALAAEGFGEVQIDRVSRYGTESASILTNPVTGSFTSLTSQTAGHQDTGDDEGALLTVDPAAGDPAERIGVREKGYLLTVVTRHEQVSRAREIVQRAGGEV